MTPPASLRLRCCLSTVVGRCRYPNYGSSRLSSRENLLGRPVRRTESVYSRGRLFGSPVSAKSWLRLLLSPIGLDSRYNSAKTWTRLAISSGSIRSNSSDSHSRSIGSSVPVKQERGRLRSIHSGILHRLNLEFASHQSVLALFTANPSVSTGRSRRYGSVGNDGVVSVTYSATSFPAKGERAIPPPLNPVQT